MTQSEILSEIISNGYVDDIFKALVQIVLEQKEN